MINNAICPVVGLSFANAIGSADLPSRHETVNPI